MAKKIQTQTPLNGPPQFYFVDKLSATKQKLEISKGMSVKDIRDLLSQTTRNFRSLIKGTRHPPHPEQGYTNADGPWRYRLSRADGSHHPGRRVNDTDDTDDTDPWRIFQTDKDLETLWEQLQPGCEAKGGEVEFQHSMQLFRDQRTQARDIPLHLQLEPSPSPSPWGKLQSARVNLHKVTATLTGHSKEDKTSPSSQILSATLSSSERPPKPSTPSETVMLKVSFDAGLEATESYLSREAAVSRPIIVDGSSAQDRFEDVEHGGGDQTGSLQASSTQQASSSSDTATAEPSSLPPSLHHRGVPRATGGAQHTPASQDRQEVSFYPYSYSSLRWPPAPKTSPKTFMLNLPPPRAANVNYHGRGRGRGRGRRAFTGRETFRRPAAFLPQPYGQSMDHERGGQYTFDQGNAGMQLGRQGPQVRWPRNPRPMTSSLELAGQYTFDQDNADMPWGGHDIPNEFLRYPHRMTNPQELAGQYTFDQGSAGMQLARQGPPAEWLGNPRPMTIPQHHATYHGAAWNPQNPTNNPGFNTDLWNGTDTRAMTSRAVGQVPDRFAPSAFNPQMQSQEMFNMHMGQPPTFQGSHWSTPTKFNGLHNQMANTGAHVTNNTYQHQPDQMMNLTFQDPPLSVRTTSNADQSRSAPPKKSRGGGKKHQSRSPPLTGNRGRGKKHHGAKKHSNIGLDVKDNQDSEKATVKSQSIKFGSAPYVVPSNVELPASGPQ
ncbi:hypothetical protein PV10_00371 [Exophiala mesophila]|uniref:Uncharacterized protein n=1 Tax=Exophiala mesophila TaxID=212818 RepID=A0A0D1X433_EXOME|nr:uncharacterized protein PV10_00371 [Exophiala mesophila]KIV96515.1 hypothetical protein PV10_00371 [Exophiala mesophila]